jgi:cytochrome P450
MTPPPPRDPFFDPAFHRWDLSRYADVQAALCEPAFWPVAARKTKNLKVPDEHAQQALRAQVLEAFSSLNEWQTRLEQIADGLPAAAPLDLVADFAEPWCLAAAEIITGSQPSHRDKLLTAARIVSNAAAEPMDEDLRQQATKADAEFAEYFRDASLPMPGPTFVALSRTVACLLANGWLALLNHPDELAKLRRHPDLIPKAIEEILRYASVPQSVFRHASRAVTLRGLNIAEGDRLILHLGSANRDPEQFSDPNRFDIARRSPAHLSLGFGFHSCAGGALIRMALTTATALFVRRFGDVTISGPVEWQGGSGFRSPSTLYVRRSTPMLNAAARQQLEEKGFLLLPALLSPPQVARFNQRIGELFALEGSASGSEFKTEPGARRIANAVDKGEIFETVIETPQVLEAVEAVLGSDFKLSSLNIRSANPHNGCAQPLHIDSGALPDAKGYSVCNSVWLLDDFTENNGALRVVPGSHKWGRAPEVGAKHEAEILITGKAGDVVVMNAHLWHGGSENFTANQRRAMHVYYTRGDKPQQQYQKRLVRPEVQARMSPLGRRLLALDDPRNDELSATGSGVSGFMK